LARFIGVYIAKYVINYFTHPMLKALSDAHLDPKLIYTHPAGFFNLNYHTGNLYRDRAGFAGGAFTRFGFFVAPALYKHERSAITGFPVLTVFLFLGGIAFGYL